MQTESKGQLELFPYGCVYNCEKIILVWQASENGHDTFKLNTNKRLVIAKTIEELKKILGPQAQKMQWNEYSEIDMDSFWKRLRNLRTGRSSSESTCKILLNGWNFIEDLARTFGLNEEMEKLHFETLNKVYHKLFFGNNLPSVTPKGKSYSPLWLPEEISLLRKEILCVWNVLEGKLYELRKE